MRWLDRLVQFPKRFIMTDNGDGTITLDPSPGTVTQAGTPVNASNLNVIEKKLIKYAFDNISAFPGYYKVTEFDTPTAGDITETIKLTADDSTYATRVTEFDTPTSGDITVTITCSEHSLEDRVVIEFDTPTTGNITETASEV